MPNSSKFNVTDLPHNFIARRSTAELKRPSQYGSTITAHSTTIVTIEVNTTSSALIASGKLGGAASGGEDGKIGTQIISGRMPIISSAPLQASCSKPTPIAIAQHRN